MRQKVGDEIMEEETKVVVKQIKREVKADEPATMNINVWFSSKFCAFLRMFLTSLL